MKIIKFLNIILIVIVCTSIIGFVAQCIYFDTQNTINKVYTYEKIIKRDYGRLFDSYEDYLVYRIEIGE